MANLTPITDDDFEDKIKESGTVVVDMSASWCGPCQKLAPIFEEIANEKSDAAKFYACDIDQARNFAIKFSVMSVPTLLVFQDGELKETIIGFYPKTELLSKLETYL